MLVYKTLIFFCILTSFLLSLIKNISEMPKIIDRCRKKIIIVALLVGNGLSEACAKRNFTKGEKYIMKSHSILKKKLQQKLESPLSHCELDLY